MKTSNKFFALLILMVILFGLGMFNVNPRDFSVATASANFIDDLFETKNDILPAQIEGYDAEISQMRPIDLKTGQFMQGVSLKPPSNEYGEVSLREYQVNEFSLVEGESVYIWIYFPHSLFYNLTIEFTDGENGLRWGLNKVQVSNILSLFSDSSDSLSGWKLIELNLIDSEVSGNPQLLSTLKISYLAENSESRTAPEKNSFAIYNIFKSNSTSASSTSGIIYSQPNVIAIYADSFNELVSGNLFVGDKYKFQKTSILSKLIVGETNELSSSKYSWKIVVKFQNGFTDNLVLGDEYEFVRAGNYSITIILLSGSSTIYSKAFTIDCEELSLGSLSSVNFSMSRGETKIIVLTISKYLTLEDEPEVFLSDKNIADLTYYYEDGKVIVTVKPKSVGTTKINFVANAKKLSDKKFEQYSYSTKMTVTQDSDFNQFYLKIFLGLLIGLVISLAIYTLILLVKHRRFVVK